jgi:HAD superfamily hydrolase (TIGR01509 family)
VLVLQAVIFDVNGTLIDSNDLHAAAWQRAFRHFGYEMPYEQLRSQVGKGSDNYIPHFLSPEDYARVGKELAQYKTELFKRDYAFRITPFPGVRELFQKIRAENLRIALATSAKGDELDQYEHILKIEGLVDADTSKDDAARSKPAPDVFAAALQRLGVRAEDAIAVGDTPYDAEACTKIGLRIIGMLCGGFEEEELLRAGCFAIYEDPADLLDRFERSPLNVHWAA